MRTNFLDWEDKQLVQIALEFEREGIRVTWDYVARRMVKSKRTAGQLRLRLAALKRTYAKVIKDFPRCFFSRSAPGRRLLSSGRCPPRGRTAGGQRSLAGLQQSPTRTPAARGRAEKASVVKEPAVVSAVQSVSLLSEPAAFSALATIFSDITASDIRQESGRTQHNAGERLPPGVATMFAAMGSLSEDDVFMDIVAGIGNVLAQVALTTKVKRCVGIEMRADLCALAVRRFHLHAATYPLLRKVIMKAADVRDVVLSSQAPTSEATMIFTNYFLFEIYEACVGSTAERNAKGALGCIYFSVLPEAQDELHTTSLRSLEACARTEGRM